MAVKLQRPGASGSWVDGDTLYAGSLNDTIGALYAQENTTSKKLRIWSGSPTSSTTLCFGSVQIHSGSYTRMLGIESFYVILNEGTATGSFAEVTLSYYPTDSGFSTVGTVKTLFKQKSLASSSGWPKNFDSGSQNFVSFIRPEDVGSNLVVVGSAVTSHANASNFYGSLIVDIFLI